MQQRHGEEISGERPHETDRVCCCLSADRRLRFRRHGRRFWASPGQFTVTARLTRISHQLTVEAHDRPAITSLRLLTVLNVLFKYASAR